MKALLTITLLLGIAVTAAADTTDKLLDLGELQMRHRDFKAALTYFDRVIVANPASVHGHLGRQEARIRLGQKEGLEADYENHYLKHLGDPGWTFLYARLLNPDEALKVLKKAPANEFFVAYGRVRALYALGKPIDAEIIQVESKCPRNPRDIGLLAGLFEDVGRYQKGIDHFTAARKIAPGRIDAIVGHANCLRLNDELDPALETIAEAVKIGKDDPEVLYRKGLIHFDRKEADLAIKSFEQSLGFLKDDVDVILVWGDAYMMKEEPQDAEQKFQLAVKLDSRRTDAHRRLAYVLEILDRNDEALASYEALARLDPFDAPCRTAMGWIYTKKGKFEKAIKEFRQAADLDSADIASMFFIGYTYDLMGRWGEAVEAYEKVTRKFPEFAPAWNNYGLDQDMLGKTNKAVKALKKAVSLDPEKADYVLNLGNAHYNGGKFKDAINAFSDAIDIDEKMVEAWTGLARSHSKLRKYKPAVEAYEEAIALTPDVPDLHLVAGILYDTQLKDYANAVAHYESYQKLGGTNPDVQTWLEEAQKKVK